MKRRNVLLGLGATTAGGSALLGSGAFSIVEAHREISIEVTGDADAYLRLGPCTDESGEPTPNGAYVVERDGEFAIDLTEDNDQVDGEGVNPESVSTFHDTFEICNQGTQSICVDFQTEPKPIPDHADIPEDVDVKPGDPSVVFYEGSDENARVDTEVLNTNRVGVFHLDPGECQCIGFTVRAFGFAPGTDLFEDSGVTFEANAGSACIDDGGDDEEDDDDEERGDGPLAIGTVSFEGRGNGKINPDGPDGNVDVTVWRLAGTGNDLELVSVTPEGGVDTAKKLKQALGINGNLYLVAVVFPEQDLAVVNNTWDGEDTTTNQNTGVRSDEDPDLFEGVDFTDEEDFRSFLEGDDFPLEDD